MTPSEKEYIELATKRGIKFLIDAEDRPRIQTLSWHVQVVSNISWYVATAIPFVREDGSRGQKSLQIARFIMAMEFGDPLEVDHINNNPLDNRKVNLRVCTHRENMMNRRIHKNNTTGFKGVTLAGLNRWAASICMNGRPHYLGVFDSPQKAHQAYCEAAVWLHGEFANFGEERSMEFRLPALAAQAALPTRLATTARSRRTRTAREGFGIWGTSTPRTNLVR